MRENQPTCTEESMDDEMMVSEKDQKTLEMAGLNDPKVYEYYQMLSTLQQQASPHQAMLWLRTGINSISTSPQA